MALHWILIGILALLLWSLADPLLAVRRGRRRVVVAVISGLILVSLYHQLLRWDIFGLTFRTLLLPVFVAIALVAGYLVHRQTGGWHRSWLWIAAPALLVAGVWMVVVPRYPDPSVGRVDLDWPLEAGRYAVIQGGAGAFNHHAAVDAQRYALDITEIAGLLDRRAEGLLPPALADYHIYGAEVLAPCDGTVLHVADERDETPVGQSLTEDVAGNMVALHCDAVTVVLAHLQAGVAVTAGQTVTAGTALGRVGSTGNSTEPHLHIHAVRGRQADMACLLFDCESVPIYFAGRTYARNDVFEVING